MYRTLIPLTGAALVAYLVCRSMQEEKQVIQQQAEETDYRSSPHAKESLRPPNPRDLNLRFPTDGRQWTLSEVKHKMQEAMTNPNRMFRSDKTALKAYMQLQGYRFMPRLVSQTLDMPVSVQLKMY